MQQPGKITDIMAAKVNNTVPWIPFYNCIDVTQNCYYITTVMDHSLLFHPELDFCCFKP